MFSKWFRDLPTLRRSLSTPTAASPAAASARLLSLLSQSHPPPTLFFPDQSVNTLYKSFCSYCHLPASAPFPSPLQDRPPLPFLHVAPTRIRVADGNDARPPGLPPPSLPVTFLDLPRPAPSAVHGHLAHPAFLVLHLGPPHPPSRAGSHAPRSCNTWSRAPVPGRLQESRVIDPE